jgi:hypothetical protein
MTSPRPAAVPVTTPRALRRRWADVLEPPSAGTRSLCLMWLHADGTALPLVVPVDHVPREAGPDTLARLVEVGVRLRDEHTGRTGHVAAALSRPGHATCTPNDRRWADELGPAAAAGGLTDWSLHLAAGGEVVPLVAPPWPAGEER